MLAPETVLQGRYRILRQLGQGGMGTVYEALDQRLDTTVALKETFFSDERLRKQFEREARLLARLHHPALPRVSDHFSEGDGQFLVMQFIPGDDLSEMMSRKSGPFPAHQVLTWADQLLDALDYLHTQDPQIVHRDIKPQNLKLTSRGQVILLDFGLAKGQAGDISRVTTSASIFGYTPNYAPLEQIQGQGTDPRSDLYSLGATLYHLVTGIKPPDALSRAAALVNGQPDPLLPAHEANSLVSPEVDEVLQKAMAQGREQRYASAAEMRNALHGSDQASTITNRGEAQTMLMPPAKTLAATTQLDARHKTVSAGAGETTVVKKKVVGPKSKWLPWAVAVTAIVVIACGAFGFYKYRANDNQVGQVSPTPTPAANNTTAAPTVPSSSTTEVRAPEQQRTPAATENTAKKTEKTTRSEEKKNVKKEEKKQEAKANTVPAPNPPPASSEGHRDRSGDTDIPDPGSQQRRNGGSTVRTGPNGAVIRNFPDGSQLITTPDGTRVYIDARGHKQILMPGQRPNRRKEPPNPPN